MFSLPALPPKRLRRSEAERPFWISFSDLMTALMVLFLVAMTVALMAITHEIKEVEDEKSRREAEINALMSDLEKSARHFPGVSVLSQVVDFGERARFLTDSHRLGAEQGELLRRFVPHILQMARDPRGAKWLKRVVVEGFADGRGNYLYNLNLSLQRSERVLCALLAPPPAKHALSREDRHMVRDIFRVSGASFNAQKADEAASRRIELRLEFRAIDEAPEPHRVGSEDDGSCPLDY